MPLHVRKNLRVRNDARYAVSLFIHHHCRHTHHVASVPELRRSTLDRMTGHARQPIAIKRAISFRARSERAGDHADGVVTAIAVASEFDALRPNENIDAGAIEWCPERVGVQRLAPLVIRLLMAMPAVVGAWKRRRLKKRVSDYSAISRQ